MATYVYPADEAACGAYRLRWPAEALAVRGHDVRIVGRGYRWLYATRNTVTGEIVRVDLPTDADTLVFQRVTHSWLAEAIPWIRSQGVAVVVDIDDDLSALSANNPAWRGLHPRFAQATRAAPAQTWHAVSLACRHASVVTVSSDALARRYAPHGRVRIIRNRVPARYLHVPHTDSCLVGWPASLFSHRGDPDPARTAISRIVRDGARFAVAGDSDQATAAAFGLQQPPETIGRVPLEQWADRVATFGIGVCPLAGTAFNRAKSWLKPLELAAVGVPWVATASPEYTRLHRLGCGLLAAKPGHWYRQLRRLLDNPGLRADLTAAGREVAAGLTIEGGCEEWLDAWAAARQQQRVPA